MLAPLTAFSRSASDSNSAKIVDPLPLIRDVYYYLKREKGKPIDPKAKEFLRYVLSREGQDAVQKDGKYLPLTAKVANEQLKKLEEMGK